MPPRAPSHYTTADSSVTTVDIRLDRHGCQLSLAVTREQRTYTAPQPEWSNIIPGAYFSFSVARLRNGRMHGASRVVAGLHATHDEREAAILRFIEEERTGSQMWKD